MPVLFLATPLIAGIILGTVYMLYAAKMCIRDSLQAFLHLRAGHILIFHVKGHLSCCIQMKKLGAGILEYAAYDSGYLRKLCLPHIQTADKNASFQFTSIKMRHKTIDQSKYSRLSAAAFPAKHHALSGRCLKVYIS